MIALAKNHAVRVAQSLVSLELVKKANAAIGHHWFDRDTMKFFRSKVGQTGYKATDGRVYFVSSEQFSAESPRRFSVRVADVTGKINTVGEMMQYASRVDANREARKLALGF